MQLLLAEDEPILADAATARLRTAALRGQHAGVTPVTAERLDMLRLQPATRLQAQGMGAAIFLNGLSWARARHGSNYPDVLHEWVKSARRRILRPMSLGVTGIMYGLESIAVRHRFRQGRPLHLQNCHRPTSTRRDKILDAAVQQALSQLGGRWRPYDCWSKARTHAIDLFAHFPTMHT